MGTDQGHRLDILELVADRNLIEEAQSIVIMHIASIVQDLLLICIFPVSYGILEEHYSKDNMNDHSLGCCWPKSFIIVHSGQLLPVNDRPVSWWNVPYQFKEGRSVEYR